jgi:hypothetical protein
MAMDIALKFPRTIIVLVANLLGDPYSHLAGYEAVAAGEFLKILDGGEEFEPRVGLGEVVVEQVHLLDFLQLGGARMSLVLQVDRYVPSEYTDLVHSHRMLEFDGPEVILRFGKREQAD